MSTKEDEALFTAIRAQDLVRVRTTLDAGASANAQRTYKTNMDRDVYEATESALLVATYQGHEPIVRLLLDRGADPNAADSISRRTPLIEAASRGRRGLVEMLLSAGADVHAKDELAGKNAMTAAIDSGYVEVARLLWQVGAPIEPFALEQACRRGYLEAAELCVETGIDVRRTKALQSAASGGRAEMIRWLAKHGADLAKDGPEALQDAANAGHAEAARALVELGVPVESPTRYGWTPLHLAAYNANAETVRVLLEAGADPRADDGSGKTPLDWARERGKAEIVEELEAALEK